jgi:ribosomal protein S18 acetylase RimI-like enzyme
MTGLNISIVEGTVDHSRFLARVVLAASRSHLDRGPFDLAFRIDETELLDILEWAVLSDIICNCHFSKFLVAERDGEPIGALAGFDPGEHGLLPLGAALADAYCGLGYDEAELPAVMARIEAMNSCFPPASPGTWIIEWVAVEPAYRGLGVCGQLMDKILAAGADRGLRNAQISTYIGNDNATAAYEKAGFRVETRRRAQEFQALLGVPGLVTMRGNMRATGSLSQWASRAKLQIAFHVNYPLSATFIPW